jgi:hypothetical protein
MPRHLNRSIRLGTLVRLIWRPSIGESGLCKRLRTLRIRPPAGSGTKTSSQVDVFLVRKPEQILVHVSQPPSRVMTGPKVKKDRG